MDFQFVIKKLFTRNYSIFRVYVIWSVGNSKRSYVVDPNFCAAFWATGLAIFKYFKACRQRTVINLELFNVR